MKEHRRDVLEKHITREHIRRKGHFHVLSRACPLCHLQTFQHGRVIKVQIGYHVICKECLCYTSFIMLFLFLQVLVCTYLATQLHIANFEYHLCAVLHLG